MSRVFALLLLFVSVTAQAALGIVDKQGVQLELSDYTLKDETGKSAPLSEYFHSNRPVLLMPVYFGCPGICTLTLNNLVTSLKWVDPAPGAGFEMLVVSIDPREGSDLARAKKQSYLKMYNRPETAAGWHFLTGDAATIARLTEKLGFQFERDEKTGQINHPAALYVFSPEGKLTSTFASTTYPHRELRVALFEAQEGKVQALVNRLTAYCYAYMPHGGYLNSPLRWLEVLLVGLLGGLVYGARRIRRACL